jgi:hypothetical protein
MAEERNAYMVPIEKPEGNSPFGRSKLRWDNNIELRRREIGWRIRTGFIWLRIGAISGLS